MFSNTSAYYAASRIWFFQKLAFARRITLISKQPLGRIFSNPRIPPTRSYVGVTISLFPNLILFSAPASDSDIIVYRAHHLSQLYRFSLCAYACAPYNRVKYALTHIPTSCTSLSPSRDNLFNVSYKIITFLQIIWSLYFFLFFNISKYFKFVPIIFRVCLWVVNYQSSIGIMFHIMNSNYSCLSIQVVLRGFINHNLTLHKAYVWISVRFKTSTELHFYG